VNVAYRQAQVTADASGLRLVSLVLIVATVGGKRGPDTLLTVSAAQMSTT